MFGNKRRQDEREMAYLSLIGLCLQLATSTEKVPASAVAPLIATMRKKKADYPERDRILELAETSWTRLQGNLEELKAVLEAGQGEPRH
jgi:hypothetical protein